MAEMELRPDSHGKVRDIYDCGDSLLMVASDRISAYDFILPDEIPHKGEILTRISAFWFERFADLIPNHMISCDVADLPEEFKSVVSSASSAATSPAPARRPTTRTAPSAASSSLTA